MALENRRAFTLVELLVVVVIISMLMALLLPAVIGARARARQTQCANSQQELGKAILQYEGAKGYLPGYVNTIGASNGLDDDGDGTIDELYDSAVSWVVMVLQYTGEGDLWKRWRKTSVTIADKVDPTMVDEFAAVTMPGLICPADDKAGIAPLSYVVNCGLSDYVSTTENDIADLAVLSPLPPGWDLAKAANAVRDPAYGLFFDHSGSASTRTRTMLDKISDGAQHTIMLSENLLATQWATTDSTSGLPRRPRQHDVGIVWWSENVVATGAVTDGDGRKINDERDTATYPNRRFDARPSSAHTGGVVVTFADGHSGFQSEDIDYSVYQSLMAPEISKAQKPNQGLVSP